MFDDSAFLRDNFTNPPGLIAFVSAFQIQPPGRSTVEKWFRRGGRASVPGDWLPVLVCLLELDRGRPVSLARYMTR